MLKKDLKLSNHVTETNYKQMTLEEIKERWSFTDQIIYKTPEVKLASLIESTKKVIAQN